MKGLTRLRTRRVVESHEIAREKIGSGQEVIEAELAKLAPRDQMIVLAWTTAQFFRRQPRRVDDFYDVLLHAVDYMATGSLTPETTH